MKRSSKITLAVVAALLIAGGVVGGVRWSRRDLVTVQTGVAMKGDLTPLASARHTVTFRNICMEPYLIRVARLPRVTGARVVALTQIRRLPISNATQKIADAAAAALK